MELTLEFDHVFCMVGDLESVASRVEDAGWMLDSGSVHPGQATRNRRLVWSEGYLELVAITDIRETAANRMRMDRRPDWATTGASPFGLGLRGELAAADRGAYWLYEDLGIPIWVHRDNEQARSVRSYSFWRWTKRRSSRGARGPAVAIAAISLAVHSRPSMFKPPRRPASQPVPGRA